ILGMYEVDVHRYLTQFLAGKAGFSVSIAEAIGAETQSLDAPGSLLDAMPGGARNVKNMRDFHFVDQARLAELRKKAFESCRCEEKNWQAIGEYLHALQDTYSHSGYERGDRDWNYHNGPVAIDGTTPRVQ